MLDFIFFLPELFLIFVLLSLCIFISQFTNKNIYKFTYILNFIEIFIIINFLIYIYLNLNSIGYNEHIIFNNIFMNTNYTIFFKNFIIFISILILIIIKDHLKIIFKNNCDFYIIYFFLIISIVFLIMCFDLIFAALIIQLQNLSFYIFFALNNKTNKSIEGALKYFFLSSVGFGIYLFGVSLIYNFCGTTKINELSYISYFGNFNYFYEKYYLIGLILICLSIFFKLSVAPFHFWAPDVYLSLDRSILIIFSIIPKISLLFFFYKFYFFLLKNFLFGWDNFLLFFIVFTFIIGILGSINSVNIQRMFAYFWIFTVGFILIFFILDFNLFFFLFLFLYSLNILNFCICLILLKETKNQKIKKELNFINQIIYIKKSNIIFYICFVISILSLMGIPPFSGFIGKFFLFFITLGYNYFFLVFITLFFTVISCFYYLRLIKILSFNNNHNWFFLDKINKKNSYILSIFFMFNIFSFFLIPFFIEFFKFLYLTSIFFF